MESACFYISEMTIKLEMTVVLVSSYQWLKLVNLSNIERGHISTLMIKGENYE